MKWSNIISFTIGVVLTLIMFKGCFNPEPEVVTTVVTKTDTIWGDTITLKGIDRWRTKHDTEYVVYPIPIITKEDTLRMMEMYKMRYFERSYRNDKAHIVIQDSILGYLMDQKVLYRNLAPDKIVDSTLVEKVSYKPFKHEISGGIQVNTNQLYITGEYKKDKDAYSLSYDPFNKQILVGYKRTLFRR
jgi:hypothetical protein